MRMPIPVSAEGFCLILLVAGSLATAPAFASEQGSFERTYQVTGAADLEALTRSGDITIRNGPAGTVTIRGKIYVNNRWLSGGRQDEVNEIEKNPPIHQNGNGIHIDYLNVHNISVDYEIVTPADTTVRTHSSSGDQSVEGLKANLTLESGSGDMRLRDILGDVDTHTGSGDVDAHDIAGSFHADAGSGDIRLQSKGSGDVRIHTGSGTIEVRDANGTLQADSGSGDVEISGIQTGTWEVRTHSGNIDLQLPSQAGFDLDASAGSGEVFVGRTITMTVQGRIKDSQHSIRGKAGGGGAQLIVHTGSGDVHID